MLTIVLRKMLRNRWMVLCLLIGSVLAVAIVSSIPLYTHAILQRMLTKDLESDQTTSQVYPGQYKIAIDFTYVKDEYKQEYFEKFSQTIEDGMIKDIGIPYISNVKYTSAKYFTAFPAVQREEFPKERDINIDTMSELGSHVQVTNGRMYSAQQSGDVIEAVVTEDTFKNYDLRLDEVYNVKEYKDSAEKRFKFKVVGTFTVKDPNDAYWFDGITAYGKSFFVDTGAFKDVFVKNNPSLLSKVVWYYALDYHKIEIDDLKRLVGSYQEQSDFLAQYRGLTRFSMQSISVIEKYNTRVNDLKIILWVLQSPILIMLSFYIFMVSQLMLEHEKNEIAVMRSRGASGLQIFWGYLLESMILSLAALAIGPPLGLMICRVLGSSNGFLEFVQRSALPLAMNANAYIYSLIAVLLFMTSMLIPAYFSSRTSIVEFKQKRGRLNGMAFWKKYFLDIVILAVSLYGLYDFKHGQKILAVTGAKGSELSINPLLFIVSSLFVLGCGLVFLRLFPYIVRLIFWLGRKIWSPVLYASFIQVGRSNGQEQFLMLFMIITLSVGIFSANSARTLNRNMEDRIRYNVGADIAIKTVWSSNAPVEIAGPEAAEIPQSSISSNQKIVYQEPPFEPYTKLDGIESAARVFKTNVGVATAGGKNVTNINLMGIDPVEFGKTAWFRPDILPYHWYQYLNLLSDSQMAVLVSTSFKDKYKVDLGDKINFSWGSQQPMEGIIYAFVDYWPTFNPIQTKDMKSKPDLIVANLSYLQTQAAKEPYEIWMKKKPGTTSAHVFDQLTEMKTELETERDASQQIIIKKNDPMLQGTNGALTMGFVVTLTISLIGFLIYWILSVQMRALQFGILRAMGLTLRKVIGMLSCEQILISGTSVLCGIIIGGITSSKFVPLLQMTSSTDQQVPPFKIIAYRADYLRLYFVVGVMLVMGIAVLWRIMSKIKISQAIKLGED